MAASMQIMKIIILLILLTLMPCDGFYLHVGNDRVKKSETNFSKFIYSSEDHESTTKYRSVQDICNISQIEDSNIILTKRSIEFASANISTTAATTEEFDISIFSQEFLNCSLITVEPECYQSLPNGTVFVPHYNTLFDRANYNIREGLLLVCPDFFDRVLEEKFPSNIGTISIVGVSISTACILLHIIVFFLVENLRNLPGYCMLSLCVALLSAYVCAFIQYGLSDHASCDVIGMFTMFTFLSSFFWMNVISYDVWQAIRLSTIKLRLAANRPILIRFGIYSCYAWGTPLLIIIVSIIIDHLSTEIHYKLIFRIDTCWFQYKQAVLLYFALPFFILLVLNILFFISSFYMITRAEKTKSETGSQVGSDLRSRLLLSLRLGSAMGLMWIFGVIATVTQREWIYYLYSICNALQGVFIFFSFTLNKKTKKACKKILKSKKFSILPSASAETTF